MVVRVDPGVSSYFRPITGANWALGRTQGEVVQEVVQGGDGSSCGEGGR